VSLPHSEIISCFNLYNNIQVFSLHSELLLYIMAQYLSNKEIENEIPMIKMNTDELGSTDTYNETKILFAVKKLGKEACDLLIKAAIQIAIIGSGNKNYGFIWIQEKNILKLEDLFNKYGILYKNNINAKLEEDTLTVRRLLRLFRYQIQNFVKNTNRTSYLWNKYAEKTNVKHSLICFPGAEHLIETSEEANFLIKTYKILDTRQNTHFVDRLNRVFVARGILSPL